MCVSAQHSNSRARSQPAWPGLPPEQGTLITWPPTKEVVGAVILQEGLDAGLARATDVHPEPSCGTAGPDLRTMGPECFPRAPGWDALKVVFEQHPGVDPQVLLQEVDPPPGRAEASTPGAALPAWSSSRCGQVGRGVVRCLLSLLCPQGFHGQELNISRKSE